MPIQLFKLRSVPEDEADDIRDLLSRHAIDYYETPAGNWGISMPAIWLHDEEQLERARGLIDDYQRKRVKYIREERERLKLQGHQHNFLNELYQNPIRLIVYLLIALAVAYISIAPFLSWVA